MILRRVLKGLQLIIVLLVICFAILQTKWAKDQIRDSLISTLQTYGFTIRAEELGGQPPFSWSLKSADFALGNQQDLHLSQVKLRIAILPLFRGKVSIDYLKIEKAIYTFASTPYTKASLSLDQIKALTRQQVESLALPCPISIGHIAVEQLIIVDRTTDTRVIFGLQGKAMIGRKQREFALDLQLLSPDQKITYLQLAAAGSKPKNFLETKCKIQLQSLSPFFQEDIDGKLAANLEIRGPWTTWNAILYDLPQTTAPLVGNLKGIAADVHFPPFSDWNNKWKFKTEFLIPSSQKIHIKKCILSSDVLEIQGKGHLCADIAQSQGTLAFVLPNLSHLSLPSLTLAGRAVGKAIYKQGRFKASFETEGFTLNDFSAMTTRGMVTGKQTAKGALGKVKLFSENAQVPFEHSFAFKYIPQKSLMVNDILVRVPEGNANGYFSYQIDKHLAHGALFASVAHIERFSAKLREENADGSFAVEIQLSSQEDEQDIKWILLGKNMRFQDMLLDDITISTEVQNMFEEPRGKFSLLAQRFYAPNIYISRLNFETSSDEVDWPFFLDAEGRLESPFQCYAKGFWHKENPLVTIELTQFFGDLALIPFSLRFPSELEWGEDYLNLSPLSLRIGEGSLYTSFEFSPVRSLAQWELKHFPLEIFSALKPRFALKGFATAQGFLDATTQNIEGKLNAVLEEANVLHFGKKEPFRAKGTLQAHLNQNKMQLFTNLSASDQQFFDLSATLPVRYQLYPFLLNLSEAQPASAEVIAEGKLEDLFDFVNLGTNRFTGLVSCRLFLSQTLAAPSLQGNLYWQNGTFENYFTGISLKNIQATCEAQNDRIQLTKLTASDDKEGSLNAEGSVELLPKKFFPYSFVFEMNNLHALGFDMIDCNLTGPLYVDGNLRNMFAQGNLLVNEALIQITENLPYEVPSLPVTYINRPPHLYTKTVAAGPKFNFHIDLELTAEDRVFVEGRGLNAELQGNIRLHGENTAIVASGDLKLLKGEYQFSGKIFKLTEGEILFNDKSAPWAYLNLNGTLSMPDITITAMLRGPLIAPQLTFQSNPQRPTSEILSLILFNKDIAEISHTEAIQLASTLVSLSGGAGPDVLDSIRKSIGIDRLNIASRKKAGDASSDEIAVEIGKYLTRGILITLSQSATSSQVIVEVELPKGFVFQAESQDEQEGKFSLKWTKSY